MSITTMILFTSSEKNRSTVHIRQYDNKPVSYYPKCNVMIYQSQVFQSQTILQTFRSLKKSQKMSSLKNPIETFDGKIFWKIFLQGKERFKWPANDRIGGRSFLGRFTGLTKRLVGSCVSNHPRRTCGGPAHVWRLCSLSHSPQAHAWYLVAFFHGGKE